MNTKACRVMIRMWKIAQAVPAMMWPMARPMPVAIQREGAAHQRDQQEDQFAGVHVAEQSHAVRDGLGDELDDLHQEVERPQQRMAAEGAVNSSCTQPPRPLIFTL
jgi:hypothetical protein